MTFFVDRNTKSVIFFDGERGGDVKVSLKTPQSPGFCVLNISRREWDDLVAAMNYFQWKSGDKVVCTTGIDRHITVDKVYVVRTVQSGIYDPVLIRIVGDAGCEIPFSQQNFDLYFRKIVSDDKKSDAAITVVGNIPVLKNWTKCFMCFRHDRAHYHGTVYGHDKISDGTEIVTAKLWSGPYESGFIMTGDGDFVLDGFGKK